MPLKLPSTMKREAARLTLKIPSNNGVALQSLSNCMTFQISAPI